MYSYPPIPFHLNVTSNHHHDHHTQFTDSAIRLHDHQYWLDRGHSQYYQQFDADPRTQHYYPVPDTHPVQHTLSSWRHPSAATGAAPAQQWHAHHHTLPTQHLSTHTSICESPAALQQYALHDQASLGAPTFPAPASWPWHAPSAPPQAHTRAPSVPPLSLALTFPSHEHRRPQSQPHQQQQRQKHPRPSPSQPSPSPSSSSASSPASSPVSSLLTSASEPTSPEASSPPGVCAQLAVKQEPDDGDTVVGRLVFYNEGPPLDDEAQGDDNGGLWTHTPRAVHVSPHRRRPPGGPPLEAPLRVSGAPREMQNMMGVLRVNPFSLVDLRGRERAGVYMRVGPLERPPVLLEWRLSMGPVRLPGLGECDGGFGEDDGDGEMALLIKDEEQWLWFLSGEGTPGGTVA